MCEMILREKSYTTINIYGIIQITFVEVMVMKKGEKEAATILKSLGVELDESYCDNNSEKSMPDLKYKDGRFIEVTHTKHK